MSDRRRIAVTGIGVISAIGNNRDEFWQSLESGSCGIRALTAELKIAFRNVAAVRDFDAEAEFESRQHQTLDRSAQLLLVAAREAIADAGVDWSDAERARTGVITGCSIGGAITQDTSYERLYGQKKSRFPPMTVPNIMPNAGASHVSMVHGLRGPSFTISSACASSSHAIGMALFMLRAGMIDAAVTGGSESMLNPGSLHAWDALRVVSPTMCRPFSAERNGMTLGEGGAMLVLETMEAARARGAVIYAELVGSGMSADAHHLTAPSLQGPVTAMQQALDNAGLTAAQIDYINAHGTGTDSNDANEALAIREVFGARPQDLFVSSTKSLHGHTIGAAGAIEAVATVLAIHHGRLPPTLRAEPLDETCAFDVVAEQSRPREIRAALSNSFAFGGLNAALAFAKADPA